MKWKKLGLIFRPGPHYEWMQSHAALPVPIHMRDDIYRVYFASRDVQNRSHVGYFDFDLEDPTRILRVSEHPVLEPGPLGYFDDHGVYASSAVMNGDKIFLYTIGWNPGPRAPLFYSSIGLAISEDRGETFTKYGRVPIIARSGHDPCLVTAPAVLKEGLKWRMWYVSGYAWEELADGLRSRYHIKYAESEDGVNWKRDGVVCIDHAVPEERNISRACVLRVGSGYETWYAFDRGQGYRIGYAESQDGIVWTRKDDEAGILPSAEGWDSETQCYPFVVEHRGERYMFYNGNGFGRDGIGLAVSR